MMGIKGNGNNGAVAMLERDVNNIRGTLGRFAPELLETEYAREMWALFQEGELTADSKLTGVCVRDERSADSDGVLLAVEDAREEAPCGESWDERVKAPGAEAATGGPQRALLLMVLRVMSTWPRTFGSRDAVRITGGASGWTLSMRTLCDRHARHNRVRWGE
jgi:hypothetical protein